MKYLFDLIRDDNVVPLVLLIETKPVSGRQTWKVYRNHGCKAPNRAISHVLARFHRWCTAMRWCLLLRCHAIVWMVAPVSSSGSPGRTAR